MKRAVLIGLGLIGAAALSGCPIYPEDRIACDTSLDCPDGQLCSASSGYCYTPGTNPSGKSCDAPSDCGFNQTCSSKGICKTGDCSFHGCVSGYTCAISEGAWACVKSSSDAGDAGDASDAGSDGSDSGSGGSGGDAATGGAGGSDSGTGGSDASSDADPDASGGSAGSDAASDTTSD